MSLNTPPHTPPELWFQSTLEHGGLFPVRLRVSAFQPKKHGTLDDRVTEGGSNKHPKSPMALVLQEWPLKIKTFAIPVYA